MFENNNRKCRKKLSYDKQLEGSTNLNDFIEEETSVSESNSLEMAQHLSEENTTSTLALAVLRPTCPKILQIQESEKNITDIKEPSVTLSGVNSLLSTPKSAISLSDTNFIASPTAIFINNSTLPDISNIENFFVNLDKQIEESQKTPKQDKNNTSNINIVEAGKSIHRNTPFADGINVCYAEFIPPENQVIIDLPTNEKENQHDIYIIDVDNDSQNLVQSFINEKTNEAQKLKDPKDSALVEIETISNESNRRISPQSTTHFLETVNLPRQNADSRDDWEIFALNKPDSPVKRSRKRKRNEENWRDNKNKKLKNSGQAYVSVRDNKAREEKSMGAVCSCKRKCYEKISTTIRKKIFNQYWGSGDHEKQWEWILRHVTASSIKKMQIERKCNRTQTIYYKLPTNDEMSTEEIVCKKMFIGTLGITEKVVYTAIEKRNSSITDLRGKHENRPRKISVVTEKSVVEHINKFPAIESHYTRKRSTKVYLNEDLNISKMYRFYKEWFPEQHDYRDCKMASKHQYEMIFNTKFNISFFKPKKDQCDKCNIYKNADEERKLQLKEEHDKHLQEKDDVRKLKDLEKCTTDRNLKTVACFDLEKVLYIPQAEASAFYYNRKFAIYNFTVYDLMRKKGYCYVWNQRIAKRGAIEVGSCLWNYINKEKLEGRTELSLYSDACTGQNRNRFIFAMYQYACKMLNIGITHRFFVSGHSQSEGDMMHSCVERAKKNQTIYSPEQMYFLIENAKVEGDKFDVKEMTRENFYDIKKLVLQKGVNWTQDNDGNKVYWSKVREIVVKPGEADTIFFKYGLNEPQKFIKTSKVIGSRRKRNSNINNTPAEVLQLEAAYTGPISIPTPLYKDLISLCQSEAIPQRYHEFYMSLTEQALPDGQVNAMNNSDEDGEEEED